MRAPFPGIGRRTILGAAPGLLLAAAVPAAALRDFRLTLLGQSLIQHDVRKVGWDGYGQFADHFAKADACFTDLETTIIGPNGGPPTRDSAVHRADETVLDCLTGMHVDFFATANNHAFDVGTGGIIDTMAALERRKLAYAGTGINLAAARRPAYLRTPAGIVALVAMATGKIRDGGAATPDRPGVNEVRQDRPGAMNEEDIGRVLDAVHEAARHAEIVIAYDHNHYWESDMAVTPDWQKSLARRCIGAGATIFVGHGAPVLQGIEIYRNRPIFYDLGNFIFQSIAPNDTYGPESWRSVVADCLLTRDGLGEIVLTPIVLSDVGREGPKDFVTRGLPQIASGSAARSILEHLANESSPLNTSIQISGDTGRIVVRR